VPRIGVEIIVEIPSIPITPSSSSLAATRARGRRGRDLTCRYDVVDAGYLLSADAIAGPAEQRAVIQFRHRRVRDDGGRAGPRDVTRRNVDALGGVVEGPSELHLRRIRVHLAGYVRLLLLRHAVDLRLIRLARRGDCGQSRVGNAAR